PDHADEGERAEEGDRRRVPGARVRGRSGAAVERGPEQREGKPRPGPERESLPRADSPRYERMEDEPRGGDAEETPGDRPRGGPRVEDFQRDPRDRGRGRDPEDPGPRALGRPERQRRAHVDREEPRREAEG